MTGYTKLFGSIIASTIWRESKETKIVWITMLAMANKNGMVEASVPGLADFARVTIEECEVALKTLLSPDSYSRTQDFNGRRIESRDGGWLVLNHAKYRAKMSLDERREYLRVKQAEHRLKDVNTVSTNVNNVNSASTLSTQSEAESDSKAKADKEKSSAGAVNLEHQAFIKGWTDNYQTAHKVKYQFDGGRDGKAVKELLRMGIQRIDLLEIAKQAWALKGSPFLATQSLTIHGFRSNFNAIQTGVKNGTHLGNNKQNPRNLNSNAGRASDYRQVGKTTHMGLPDAGTAAT